VIAGQPDQAHMLTSIVKKAGCEHENVNMSFARLTNAFSTKVEELHAAVALHFAHYNFVRMHKTSTMTPAMARTSASGLVSRRAVEGHQISTLTEPLQRLPWSNASVACATPRVNNIAGLHNLLIEMGRIMTGPGDAMSFPRDNSSL